MLFARDDIHLRDRALARRQLTKLDCSLQQILTSSSDTFTHHVTLLEQTTGMAQFSACTSTLQVADAHSQQLNEQHQQMPSEHDTLVAQVTKDDSVF